MATETKVGLLAGLAFIVCFAVILANRGQPQVVGGYQSLFVSDEAPAAVPLGVARAVAQGDERAPARTRSTAAQDSLTLRQPPPSTGSYTLGDQGGGREPQGTYPDRQVQAPGVSGAELSWSSESDAPPRTTESMLSAFSGNAREPSRNLDEYLNERQDSRPASTQVRPRSDAGTPFKGTSTEGPHPHRRGAHEQRSSGTTGAAYTVVSGDTLTSIVERHYGSRSKRHIDAVLDANRSLLADPDILKVGMVLALPAVTPDGGPNGPSAQSTGTAVHLPTRARTSNSSAGQPNGFRWYQVRPNDRYMTIAQDQLGDARRWKELYELNKDKFPDPDRIREGVRIKLPVDEVAGNGRRR